MEPLILEMTWKKFRDLVEEYLIARGDFPPLVSVARLDPDRNTRLFLEFKYRGSKVTLEIETLATGSIRVTEGAGMDDSPETKKLLRDFWREFGPGKRGGAYETPREQRKEFVREWIEIRDSPRPRQSQKNFCIDRPVAPSTLRKWTRELEPEIRAEEMRAKGLS